MEMDYPLIEALLETIIKLLVTLGIVYIASYLYSGAEYRYRNEESTFWKIVRVFIYTILTSFYVLTILRWSSSYLNYPELVQQLYIYLPLLPEGFVPAAIGLLILLPAIRKIISRFIPIDPKNMMHATALSLFTRYLLSLLIVYFNSGWNSVNNITTSREIFINEMLEQWVLAFIFSLAIFWTIGKASSYRNRREVFQRLGLVRPTIKHLLRGLVIGVGMVVFINALFAVLSSFGIEDTSVVQFTKNMLPPEVIQDPTLLITAMLTIGITAGVWEEMLFRGALQPRFGLIYTAILFTFLHAQYGLSIYAFGILIFALLLGRLRRKFDTTTTILVHTVYNMILVLAYTLANP